MIKLITEHKDYLLLVDESVSTKVLLENPEWWVYCRNNTVIRHKDNTEYFCDKIIAHLPLNNAPTLEGVSLLPEFPKTTEQKASDLGFESINKECPNCGQRYNAELPKQEEDVADLARKHAENVAHLFNPSIENYKLRAKNSFQEGYKVVSKKWSDEDMKYFAKQCAINQFRTSEQVNKAFQSLSPTLTPIGFEPEYEDIDGYNYQNLYPEDKVLKIVNGVLQGKYIFK